MPPRDDEEVFQRTIDLPQGSRKRVVLNVYTSGFARAGLLNIVESAPYGVTKHAAVAIAEWLRIAYGRKGVRVSCLCPQSVQTDMVTGDGGSAGHDGILTPAQVAAEVMSVIRDETFLILPHPSVLTYFRAKGQDYDRWIGGMQKLYQMHVKG